MMSTRKLYAKFLSRIHYFLVGFVKLMDLQLKLNLVLRKAFLFRFEVPEKVISVS